jgi:hypothetical protein
MRKAKPTLSDPTRDEMLSALAQSSADEFDYDTDEFDDDTLMSRFVNALQSVIDEAKQ